MRTFFGALIGCAFGFMSVPILIGLFADVEPNAIDSLFALILAVVGGIVGAKIGGKGGTHERST